MEESNLSNKVSARVETITPEIASRYLLYNNINRPLKKGTVDYYAEQMRKGQWLLNGEAICFAEDGGMVNGQHRLNAIIKAGVPVDILVVRGCDPNSFNVYDSGVNRTTADIFALNGIPNSHVLSTIIVRYFALKAHRMFVRTDTKEINASTKNLKKSRLEMLGEYNSSPELYQEIYRLVASCVSKLNLFTKAEMGGFCAYLIKDKQYSFDIVSKFMRMLFWNDDVTNETIHILREKIVRDRMNAKSIMSPSYKQAILIKTWNAYITRKELKVLNYNREKEGDLVIL